MSYWLTPPWAIAYAKRVASSTVYGYPHPGNYGLGHVQRSPRETESGYRVSPAFDVWVTGWRTLNDDGAPFDHPDQLKAIDIVIGGDAESIVLHAFESIAAVVEDRCYDHPDWGTSR